MSRWSVVVANLIFFLSGAAALIYEISWARQLGLLFGHTVHAASVVLASYFAGMAIGYALGARLSRRLNPLKSYAVAEVVVALWAVLIPVMMGWVESPRLVRWLTSDNFFWQICLRGGFSFLLLLPATIALGVTLPLMATWLSDWGTGRPINAATNSWRISLAYAGNTAGALVGVTAATVWMMVNCGVCGSSYVAAGLSSVCGICAWWLAGGNQPELESRELPKQTDDALDGQPSASTAPVWQLPVVAGVTGFSTLALQVLYTRMFSLVFHNSTYTFGIVVAVFLAALALGAALASVLLVRLKSQHVFLAIKLALVGAAFWVVVSVMLFVRVTELNYLRSGETFVGYMLAATGHVAIVVAPGILMLGTVLPMVWKIAGDGGQSAGQIVGRLTCVNTIAAAIGAVSASFLLLPWLGLWSAFVVIGGALIGLAWSVSSRMRKFSWVGLTWAVCGVVTLFSPTESAQSKSVGEKTLRRWNSAYGWIDLVKDKDAEVYKIRQNLHYRFGKTGNNAREYRQAHLPLLLHPNPSKVLFLGLGTGLTAGGAVPHRDVQSIVAVELIPQVVEAARELGEHNFDVVQNPKTEIVCDDGRHYLLGTDQKFNVIVSDLFVPWESESGYLYTREHYQVASRRLTNDGLFCQWLPLYQVGAVEFEAIANSFSSVFPSTTVWWGKLRGSRGPVLALIGQTSGLRINTKAINQRIAALHQSMGQIDPSIANADLVIDHFAGQWDHNSQGLMNLDEYPVVEFLTPVSNRDRKLLSGFVFEDYFESVIARLPMSEVVVDGKQIDNLAQRRDRQRPALFGGQ